MTKLDAGLITPLPASDSGSAVVWGSKRKNPLPQSCLCLTWSGYPSNDDDDETDEDKVITIRVFKNNIEILSPTSVKILFVFDKIAGTNFVNLSAQECEDKTGFLFGMFL